MTSPRSVEVTSPVDASRSVESAAPSQCTNYWNQRNVYTAVLLISSFACSLSVSVLGPSLLDIAESLGATLAQVTYGPAAMLAGGVVGSIIGGYALDHLNRQLCYASCFLVTAIFACLIPIQQSVLMYLLCCAVQGIVTSAADILSRTWALQMWSQNPGPCMQALGFVGAIGIATGPFTVIPFLSPSHAADSNATAAAATPASDLDPSYNMTTAPSQIQYPFFICGAGLLIPTMILFALYFLMPFRDAGNDSRGDGSNNQKDRSMQQTRALHILTLVMGGILMSCCMVVILNTGFYFTMFVVSMEVGFRKELAVTMASVMTLVNIVGVGIGILVATRISASKMLPACIVTTLAGNILLALSLTSVLFDPLTHTSLAIGMTWCSVVLMGVTSAGSVSSLFAFLDKRIGLNNRIIGSYSFVSTLLNIGASLILGQLISSHPCVFLGINMVGLTVCLLILAAFFLMDRLGLRQAAVAHNHVDDRA